MHKHKAADGGNRGERRYQHLTLKVVLVGRWLVEPRSRYCVCFYKVLVRTKSNDEQTYV